MNEPSIFKSFSPSTSESWDRIVRSPWHPTLSIGLWGFVISVLTILLQAVAIGLFKLWRVGLFALLPESLRSWVTDQLRVGLVGYGAPFKVLWCTPALRTAFGGLFKHHRPLERSVASLWWLGALILALLPLATSPLISITISVVSGIPGSISDCSAGISFRQPEDTAGELYGRYWTLAGLDWFRQVDTFNFNFNGTTAQSVGLPGPKDSVVVSDECPDWALVCDRNNSLRVDIQYSIGPTDLGVGTPNWFSAPEFTVRSTCYKVESHTKFLYLESAGTHMYGLMYGDRVEGFPNVTALYRAEERYGIGYSVDPHFDIKAEGQVGGWAPNTTLSHEGDLTLLIYHIGAVDSIAPSDDPIFATFNNINETSIFTPLKATVPVMCNTTFEACHNGECTPLNGTVALEKYVIRMQSDAVTKGFFDLMSLETSLPLLFSVAGTPDSVLASHTLSLNALQYAATDLRGYAEIVRLALTGRTRLITAAHRAASTWRKYLPSGATSENLLKSSSPDLKALCGATLIDNSDMVTIAGIPFLTLLFVLLAIVSLSISGPLWRWLFWSWTDDLVIRWRSRGVGQMHRMVHEKEDASKLWYDADKQWPRGRTDVEPFGLILRKDEKSGYHPVYSPEAVRVKIRRHEIS